MRERKATRLLAVALLVLGLAACAAREEAARPHGTTGFPFDAVEETLALGLERIKDKYLEDVSVARLAMEGLRSFVALDPELGVDYDGKTVNLRRGDREIVRLQAPADDRANAWAKLIIDIMAAAGGDSPDIPLSNSERLLEVVFDGALSGLDAFSRYAGANEARKNREKRDGFGGIGVLFRLRDGEVLVTRVLPDTSAAKVGIRAGDRLTHVGAVPLKGLDEAGVTAQLHGPIGSSLRVRLIRDGQSSPIEVLATRSRVVPPTVEARLDGSVLAIEINGFNQDTGESIERYFYRLSRQTPDGLSGLVIDMRGNPGGLLSEAVEVAGLFLDSGEVISTRGRHPDSNQYHRSYNRTIARGLPMVVLIDGRSASAAEVVAAALQDRGRAIVMGTTSFGKGTVQTVLRLPNDGEMTLTWSRLVTPSGYALHGLGVLPDVCLWRKSHAAVVLSDIRESDGKNAADNWTAWRKVEIGDEETRGKLRRICPAADRHGPEDRVLAVRLLTDRPLYLKAMAAKGFIGP